MLKGVYVVAPGYVGGHTENPTYAEVSSGNTGHAEVIRLEYNPEEITYEDLLTVFFGSHDPTTRNKQGNDVGTQYRSVIFFTSEAQKEKAHKFIASINASNETGKPVVTELEALKTFYEAENYHKDYYANHGGDQYCELVINPKLKKVTQKFANLLKEHQKNN